MENFANSSFQFKGKEQWWKKTVDDGRIIRFVCLPQFKGHSWSWVARRLDPILEEMKSWSGAFNSTWWKWQCLLKLQCWIPSLCCLLYKNKYLEKKQWGLGSMTVAPKLYKGLVLLLLNTQRCYDKVSGWYSMSPSRSKVMLVFYQMTGR